MAQLPDQRFQPADELVAVLKGGRSVPFLSDVTQTLPSMGARLQGAPTTPLPRATGARPPGVPATITGEAPPPRRSVLSALFLWLLIVGSVLGGGGFYAYKQGLIFAKSREPIADSTAARDTTHPDPNVAVADTARQTLDSSRTATVRAPPPASGPPGRLVLPGVP